MWERPDSYRKIHTIEMKSRSSHDSLPPMRFLFFFSFDFVSTKFKQNKVWGCEKQMFAAVTG